MQRIYNTDEETSLPQHVREEITRREIGPWTLADIMREIQELKAMIRDLQRPENK